MNNGQKKIAPEAATPETKSNNNITTSSIAEKEEKIKVVLQCPGEISRVVTVMNTLETMQELVGGHIEVHALGVLLIVMNEEGRLKDLPANVRCVQYGTIVGSVFITVADGEDFRSLTTEEIQSARAWLMKHSV